MNKQQFLKKLNSKLKKLKKEERKKYIEYYNEMISDIMEHGMSEEVAIEKQGNIEQIAKEIIFNTSPTSLKNRDWRGIVLVVVSLVLLFSSTISLILKLQMQTKVSASLSIIGGADGPTSIFVAGEVGMPWGLYIATGIVVISTLFYLIKRKVS